MMNTALVILCLALAASTASAADVTFFLYTKSCPNGVEVTRDSVSSYTQCNYNPAKCTIIVIHGLSGSRLGDCPQVIMQSYIDTTDCNVILVDYKPINSPYDAVKKKVGYIADQIVAIISCLKDKLKTDYSKIHLVGHSLGAHIGGTTGSKCLQKLERITGLDPAGPGYDGKNTTEMLDKSDATFVDVIHTTDGVGFHKECGHNDYYPNGGKAQKECAGNDFLGGCSHKWACTVWARLVRNNNAYPADKAVAYSDAANKACARTATGHMGPRAIEDPAGCYCVPT